MKPHPRQALRSEADTGRALALELRSLGNEKATRALIEYTLGWIRKTRNAIERRRAEPSRVRVRRTVAGLGADLERLGKRLHALPPDGRFLVTCALRDRRGPDIQESRRAWFAESLLAYGAAIRKAGERRWPQRSNDELGLLVYLLAGKYHELLGLRPAPSAGARFHRFVSAALNASAPGRGARAIGPAVKGWLADHPTG